MSDVFTKDKRSAIMSKVKSKGNLATEKKLIALFKVNCIKGWRRDYPLFGKPDFVFPKKRVAVFVDGEFWHGHPSRGQIPKTNKEFWRNKLERNKARDCIVNETLCKKNWKVVRIWQHELRNDIWLEKIQSVLELK